jgi:hypothetical protein
MARIQGRYYSIESARFVEIGNEADRRGAGDAGGVLDYLINTDWSEGGAHQRWLDTADAVGIAAWVASGLADIALMHHDDGR